VRTIKALTGQFSPGNSVSFLAVVAALQGKRNSNNLLRAKFSTVAETAKEKSVT
jgi:hypothetical protein